MNIDTIHGYVGPVCQSDDQFYLWDWAIRNNAHPKLHSGLIVSLTFETPFVFEGRRLHTCQPFAAYTHRLAEHIRHMEEENEEPEAHRES